MQLEVGKKYRNRSGEIREIAKEDQTAQYPFLDSRGKTYLANGRYTIQGGQSEDLIEEVPPPPGSHKPNIIYMKQSDTSRVDTSQVYTFDNLLERVETLNAKLDEALQRLPSLPEKKEPRLIEVKYHDGLNRYLFFFKGKEVKRRAGDSSISREIETLNHWLQYAYNKGLEDVRPNRP